jgi:hypothetical protein
VSLVDAPDAPGRDTLLCLEIAGASVDVVEKARRTMITAPRAGVPLLLGKTTRVGARAPTVLRIAVGAPAVSRLWNSSNAEIAEEAGLIRREIAAWAETGWS